MIETVVTDVVDALPPLTEFQCGKTLSTWAWIAIWIGVLLVERAVGRSRRFVANSLLDLVYLPLKRWILKLFKKDAPNGNSGQQRPDSTRAS